MSALSTHIGSHPASYPPQTVLDRLLGWRLFGVYDAHTHWPGFDPHRGLDPATRERLFVQLALQELA